MRAGRYIGAIHCDIVFSKECSTASGNIMTADVAMGQVWEVCSPQQQQWSRVIVADIRDQYVTLRYEGTLELLRVAAADMEDSKRFRLAAE